MERTAGKPASAGSTPNLLRQTLERGVAYQRAGKFKEAERIYHQILQRVPNQPDALNFLGVLAVEADQPSVAVDLIGRANKVRPRDHVILNNLGNALMLVHEMEKAVKHLKTALAIAPDFPEALYNMGRALRGLGRAEEAKAYFEKVLSIKADFVQAHSGLGRALLDLGRLDEAADKFRQVIALEPDHAAGYVDLARARRFTAEDTEPDRIKALLARGELKAKDRIRLHYAAGKIHDDLGRFDDAFDHFRQANDLAGNVFDFGRHAARYDRLIDVFSAGFLAERQDFGDPSELPVFIVGVPRSGTTLVEQIVASHPRVRGAGELGSFGRLVGSLPEFLKASEPYPDCVGALTPERSRELARRYLQELEGFSRGALRVTDKMPHNFERLGLIALLLPRARIIHCRRNPLDTCLSCFSHQFHEKHGYNCDLRNIGLYYRQYERLMVHWRSALPLKMIEVTYEELIANQESVSRRLVEFLGVEWDDRCLHFHSSERMVQTPSNWEVRQPLYTRSVERWRNYEKHLGPLKEALGL